MQCQTKLRWRFCKILWPSQNIWTLTSDNIGIFLLRFASGFKIFKGGLLLKVFPSSKKCAESLSWALSTNRENVQDSNLAFCLEDGAKVKTNLKLSNLQHQLQLKNNCMNFFPSVLPQFYILVPKIYEFMTTKTSLNESNTGHHWSLNYSPNQYVGSSFLSTWFPIFYCTCTNGIPTSIEWWWGYRYQGCHSKF